MAAADQIIVPLDVPDEAAAIALLDRLPHATFWKVGLELFVSVGPRILEILKERDKRIFLDLKFHDIPNTMAGACRSAARYGVDLMTVHAAAGSTALKTAHAALLEGAEASGQAPPKLLAITLLTSLTSRSLAFELNVPVELPEYVLKMALLAQESGLAGIVCSPQEAGQVRDVCGSDFLRVCPGVRPAWSAHADQRRLLTPKDAMTAGANYLVIGRPITASEDPVVAFQRVCEELDA
ncbi:MAG: orotidine-5'-phosphate decarboxylase [Leptolyngbyaceae bacterium]|nr:orotidine-5'-phosphate decarboxylase [Leptolyngbyaceae bacterium]